MIAVEMVSIGFAALSAACSASIVLTGLVFPSIMLSPLHPFSNILFIIALADMIACIGLSFGYPREGSNLCTTQAFFAMFFVPATWLWSSALVYQMHCMIVYKQLYLNMTQLHIICWTIAGLVALLPLTRDPYGQDDDLNDSSICWLHCKEHDCYLWTLGLYIPTLLMNISLMSYYLHKVYAYLKSQKDGVASRERVLFRSLYFYPIGLIVCWTFTIIAELLIAAELGYRKTLVHIAVIIPCQYGTICCIIFFSNSALVRTRWWAFLTCNYRQYAANSTDSSSTDLSRLSFLSDLNAIEIPPSNDMADPTDQLQHYLKNITGFNDGNIELRDRSISIEPDSPHRTHEDTRNILHSSSGAESKKDIDP